ncbi:MAG: ABC transporter substrate-binding protein [Pyrinomonadaceae bacterium]|nr:ABC transporter substrate-binding protein [Pyrinomonadaceae bacterium]
MTSCVKQEGGGVSGVSGAGASEVAGIKKEGKLVIGFAQMENNNPWRIAETNSFREEAAKRGHEIVVSDAQGDAARQVNNVEDLVTRRVDVIMLPPREFEGLSPALKAAREAKIPVFLIDREAAGTSGEDYVAFIGSNFVQQGQRAGEWLINKTGGKANIVELQGTSGASVTRDRKQGFADAISKSPDMKIIASQTANFSRAEGQKVMETIIQARGKEITAVYAHNDEMAIGAIQALKAAGMKPGTDVLVVSVDGEKDALKAITAGEMNVTVESNPRLGPLAFDTLERFRRGEKIEPRIIIQDRLFDSSNAAQFVDEAY